MKIFDIVAVLSVACAVVALIARVFHDHKKEKS